MTHSLRYALASALLLGAASLGTTSVEAQAGKADKSGKAAKSAQPAMDHGKDHNMEHAKGPMSDHAQSGWKELDAYHQLMMDTWHPAKGKNDMKPFKARANDMAAAAKLLSMSTPPKGCDAPGLRKASTDLSPATADAAVLVARNASDAELKTALAALHERFEVLEKGCSAQAKAKH